MAIEKFLIWGIGERGKIITEFLEESQIIAYIDTDKNKQGTYYRNHPVISFEEYLEKFYNCFIIVTPVDEDLILEKLQTHQIKKIFRMSHLPSEMQGYGEKKFLDKIKIPLVKKGNNIIWGSTLYSCILYRKIEKMGFKNVFLFKEPKDEIVSLLEDDFKYNTISHIDREQDNIILTTAEKEKASVYCGKKILDFFDNSEVLPQYYHRELEKFCNIYKGKRCFIVATGPSLQQDDLKMLSKNNEICFGVNRIFNIDKELWKPQYYIFVDRAGMKKYWEDIASYDVEHKFVGDSYWKDINYKGTMHIVHALTGHSFNVPPEFSEHIERKVYAYATVTYVAIQIAIYMGFTQIYLLGVDCNYKKNIEKNYFFDEKEKDKYNHYEDRMIIAYKVAKKYADTHGIKIINASRGGNLEVFDRIDFEKIFV